MNWYEIVLGVVLIAVSVLIVVFTLAQEQKGQGLSKLTKICGVVFFVVTLVVCVLSARL